MKASDITDCSIESPTAQIVIELPNGQRLSTQNYYYDTNKRNELIIVIKAGRKLDK